jgi:DNA segregation ATPase FtsK/SpoIIIE-like protein
LIKANLPSRIAFRVASKVDSRTILDGNGAEQLLGKGDMLYLPPASSRFVRIHGPYISEQETARVCSFLKKQGKPTYDRSVTEDEKPTATRSSSRRTICTTKRRALSSQPVRRRFPICSAGCGSASAARRA